jgi:hypothetical protein
MEQAAGRPFFRHPEAGLAVTIANNAHTIVAKIDQSAQPKRGQCRIIESNGAGHVGHAKGHVIDHASLSCTRF